MNHGCHDGNGKYGNPFQNILKKAKINDQYMKDGKPTCLDGSTYSERDLIDYLNGEKNRCIFFVGEDISNLTPFCYSLSDIRDTERKENPLVALRFSRTIYVYLNDLLEAIQTGKRVFVLLPCFKEDEVKQLEFDRTISLDVIKTYNGVSGDHCQPGTNKKVHNIYVCEGTPDNPLSPIQYKSDKSDKDSDEEEEDEKEEKKDVKKEEDDSHKLKFTEYSIYDNGGIPFVVKVDDDYVYIYYNYEHEKELITKVPYEIVWIGDNELKDNQYAPYGEHIGNSILVQIADTNDYMYIGSEIYKFTVENGDKIKDYFSPVGNNSVPYPYAIGEINVYFMLNQKYVPVDTIDKKVDGYTQFYDQYEYESDIDALPSFKNVEIIEGNTF